MKVWIGHYNGNPKEWFVVWARDLHEAWDVADQQGDVDTHSLREVASVGIVNFHSNLDEEGYPSFTPAKDKNRNGNWLILGDQTLLSPHDYIKAEYSARESNKVFNLEIWRGRYLANGGKSKKNDYDGFLVWAKDKQEALSTVNKIFGNVDENSLVQIREIGFVDFHVSYREGKLAYSPPKEDLENDFWIVIGWH